MALAASSSPLSLCHQAAAQSIPQLSQLMSLCPGEGTHAAACSAVFEPKGSWQTKPSPVQAAMGSSALARGGPGPITVKGWQLLPLCLRDWASVGDVSVGQHGTSHELSP